MAYLEYGYFHERKQLSKWKKFKRAITPGWWDGFWYSYTPLNDIIGPGYACSKNFRESRLALVIGIAAFLVLTTLLIIHW